jgi:hypothetical protein
VSSTRGLDWSDVRSILDEFHFKYEVDPHGFTVRAPVLHGYRNSNEDWRLRCGSGIAGRGGHWTIVRVQSGEALSNSVSTRAALRRALREHLAGPVPDPGHRDRYYATKHHTRFQSGHYIWKLKRSAPLCKPSDL